MKINWFPGHMRKTLKTLSEEIKNVDVVLYVLDSRAPYSCLNPSFVKIIGHKPIVYVLNKADLVPEEDLKDWKKYFEALPNSTTVSLNSTVSNNKAIISGIRKILKGKIDFYLAKGAKKTFRAMIIGVPNCGKSTLANNLCGKAKTITGNKPGVTKSKQWVKVDDWIEVLDTPGTLWPSFDNQEIAKHLAFIGSIKEEVLNKDDLAIELLKWLNHNNPNAIFERYGVESSSDTISLLDTIAMKKGFKLKGNELDYDRVIAMIITDFKNGKLGNKILDNLKDAKCV